MNNGSINALCIITDNKYLNQTIFLIRQIRVFSKFARICILLLENLKSEYAYALLNDLNVEIKIYDCIHKLKNHSRTGLKMLVPFYFSSPKYILLDSDIFILNANFFESIKPVKRKITLVKESELVWESGFKGLCNQNHALIIGKPIFQTGVISFYRNFWEEYKDEIFKLIERDRSDWGDMVAINMFCYQHNDLVNSLSERVNLVIRPNGKGKSTICHILRLKNTNGRVMYKDLPVYSFHYTHSNGILVTYDNFNKYLESILPYDLIKKI